MAFTWAVSLMNSLTPTQSRTHMLELTWHKLSPPGRSRTRGGARVAESRRPSLTGSLSSTTTSTHSPYCQNCTTHTHRERERDRERTGLHLLYSSTFGCWCTPKKWAALLFCICHRFATFWPVHFLCLKGVNVLDVHCMKICKKSILYIYTYIYIFL